MNLRDEDSLTVSARLIMWKFLVLPVNRFFSAAAASFGLQKKKQLF